MGFFADLFEKLDGCEVELFIKRNNNKLNVKVLPTMKNLDKDIQLVPMSITGNPVDIDNNFEAYIGEALKQANTLQVDTEGFKESLEKAGKKKPSDKKSNKKPKQQETKIEKQKEEKEEKSQDIDKQTGEIKQPEKSGTPSLEDLKKRSEQNKPVKENNPVQESQENQSNTTSENTEETKENEQIINDNGEW